MPSRNGGSLKSAVAIGSTVAVLVYIASEVAFGFGAVGVARTLLWQSSLLQHIVPTPTGAMPLIVAWYLGAFLGVPIYGSIAYLVLNITSQVRAL